MYCHGWVHVGNVQGCFVEPCQVLL